MSEDGLVPWLRAQVEADKAAASAAGRRIRVHQPEPWYEADDNRFEWPEDAAHIAIHDPRDTIARCEAELAVLDAHYILWRHDTTEEYEEFSVVSIGGANQDHGCVTCHYYGRGGVKGYGYCRTVRVLGWGYRFGGGYREAWKP